MTLRWEEPPKYRFGPVHDWHAIGWELKKRPGQWAIVAVCNNSANAGSTARHIREGGFVALGSGFEAVARTVEREPRVYARYVGKDDPR